MKILLADDDEDQLALRSLSLARAGHHVWTASDEQAALRLASEHSPRVAVIDLRMPSEEAGRSLIRALKAFNEDLHLILLTGSAVEHFESLPEAKLVEKVLTKGMASRKLIAYLRVLAST